tara:strand:- start:401 stop:1240 length:840 start_codon:yes stop_codon:yes gene_type:complete
MSLNLEQHSEILDTWGKQLLTQHPWVECSERVSLFRVLPGEKWNLSCIPNNSIVWLIIDRDTIQSLPRSLSTKLLKTSIIIEEHREANSNLAISLFVFTLEHLENTLERAGRNEMETRWLLSGSSPISDRLQRHETLISKAKRVPTEGLERATRSLWHEINSTAQGLWTLAHATENNSLILSEFLINIIRLGCLIDYGCYPPVEELKTISKETSLGKRLANWFKDVEMAISKDSEANNRIIYSHPQVIEEIRNILNGIYRGQEWIDNPLANRMPVRIRS